MNFPEPDYRHLLSLIGEHGVYEHAEFAAARIEHGYCTDDVARVLVVTTRELEPSVEVALLAKRSMEFLLLAQDADGGLRNRRSTTGEWLDKPTTEDCWGRSLWAFGTAAARSSEQDLRDRALEAFTRSASVCSPWPRAMAFATLGAIEVLGVLPTNRPALELINAAASVLNRQEVDMRWRWPEHRLTYANAVLPEALLAAGLVLGDAQFVETSLRQLCWLLERETAEGVLNVTPAGGIGRFDERRRFDQQPIEVAALADACVRAWQLTKDHHWLDGLASCAGWFVGENVLGQAMYDEATGGGYDGLTALGPNLNQGAESTLALLATLQHAELLVGATS